MAAQQGAALQTYNNELVQCLEELCERRDCLQKDIDKEKAEKESIESQMRNLQQKLDRVNASLSTKMKTRAKYDKIIQDSEQAYLRILESSQVLLNVVKQDSKALQQNLAQGKV
jgi:Sjoegren syndrome nuclear autoantigen 1